GGRPGARRLRGHGGGRDPPQGRDRGRGPARATARGAGALPFRGGLEHRRRGDPRDHHRRARIAAGPRAPDAQGRAAGARARPAGLQRTCAQGTDTMTTMTIDRLRTMLDAYGAAPARWPEAEREAALTLIAQSPEARAAVDEA